MTGFGLAEVKPYFWLIDQGAVGTNMHVAFTVDSRADVDTFYRAALQVGATSRESPGSTPNIMPTTTARSSTIRTASISRRSVTGPGDRDRSQSGPAVNLLQPPTPGRPPWSSHADGTARRRVRGYGRC